MTSTTAPTTCHEAALKVMAEGDGWGPAFHRIGELDGDVNYGFDAVASRRHSATGWARGLRVTVLLRADGSVAVTHWNATWWQPLWKVTVNPAWPITLAERAIELAITHAVMEEYGRRD
jgi:hypothetical protein